MLKVGSLLDNRCDFILYEIWVLAPERYQNKPGLAKLTLVKIFFFSYSLSSGTDFSRKNRALSVVADMIKPGAADCC